MYINEALNPENKKKFRELAKKLHPDINKDPDAVSKMQKLNAIDNDRKFIEFYNEIMGIKKSEKKPQEQKTTINDILELKRQGKMSTADVMELIYNNMDRPARFKTDDEWLKWMNRFYKKKDKKRV